MKAGPDKATTGERIAFGLVIGASFPLSWALSPWASCLLLALIVAGQFISAITLRRLGLLDEFFNQYIEGAVIFADGEHEGTRGCGQSLCGCGPLAPKAGGRDTAR